MSPKIVINTVVLFFQESFSLLRSKIILSLEFIGFLLGSFSKKIYMTYGALRNLLERYLILLYETIEPWRLIILILFFSVTFVLILFALFAFINHIKKLSLIWQKEKSLIERASLTQVLSRWIFEVIYNILDVLWVLLEPHPNLYNRDSIRLNVNRLIHKLKSFSPFTQKSFGYSKLKDGLLSLMDEGRGEVPKDIPPDLIASINSTATDLLVLPDVWRKILSTVLERHKAGNYASLFIAGSQGSGKTAVLDWFASHTGMTVYRFSPESREEALGLLKKILETEYIEPAVLIIDNLEYFYLRKPGGHKALEELLLHNDGNRGVLKVFASGSVFYHHCSAILPLKDLFPFHLDLNKPGAEHLASIFDKRLGSAGYQYKVIPDRHTYKELLSLKKRHALAEEEIPVWLKKRFFNNLSMQGGSGYQFVNYYFLKAVSGIRDGIIRIKVKSPELFNLSFVADWPLENLFLLQSIYIHRSLSVKELAKILLLPENKVAMDLAKAREHSLLVVESGQYSINPLVHKILLDELLKIKLLVAG